VQLIQHSAKAIFISYFFKKKYSLPRAHYRALDKGVLFFFYIFFASCHIKVLGKSYNFFVFGIQTILFSFYTLF